ncbi:MAG: cytochrome c1 [Alphaproteobacteria bacterium]
MKRATIATLAAAVLGAGMAYAAEEAADGAAASHTIEIPSEHWSWDGIFGGFDQAQLQRGYLVYERVCSACHSMNLLAFRHLHGLGFDESQIESIAAARRVSDIDLETGDTITRAARPADHFPAPFANEIQARSVNNGALPPDLSVIVKARVGEADYIHALLTGYEDAPAGIDVPAGKYYNAYFPGHVISMAPPLSDGLVDYIDGTPNTRDQMARDVSAFLAWAAEPSLVERKELGVKVVLFLIVLAGVAYAVKRKVWSDVEH